MELLAEGQQLEEELKQIVDYTQGSSLARLRISSTRHKGCDRDVCMMSMHVNPVMTLSRKFRDLLDFFQKHRRITTTLDFNFMFIAFSVAVLSHFIRLASHIFFFSL